jgi:hypothetical protein
VRREIGNNLQRVVKEYFAIYNASKKMGECNSAAGIIRRCQDYTGWRGAAVVIKEPTILTGEKAGVVCDEPV